MRTVETTLGRIGEDQLGLINSHEHIIIDGGYTVLKQPDFKLDSVEKAVAELGQWKAAGGGAIVDTMPFGCGRNVKKLIAASQGSDVPIVVPTGFQHSGYYLPDHWQHRYDEGSIADLLIAECLEGVDENNYDGPVIVRSPVKAGLIKVAGDYQFVTDTTKKLIRAAGRAHRRTGTPVLVHTDMGTACDELLDLLEDAGVPANRVLLCHTDRNPDIYVHKRLAKRGAYLEYDTPGRIKYQPESLLVRLLHDMFELGLGDRVMIGGDMARRSYWSSYGGGPGLSYLLTKFNGRLLDEGFSTTQIDQIWHRNPVDWLCGQAA